MSQNTIIAKEDLDSYVEKLFETHSNWSNEITVRGLPKTFDATAIKDLLLELNKHTFDVLSKATGFAYLRNHSTVEYEDCIAALKIKDSPSIKTVLDAMEDN